MKGSRFRVWGFRVQKMPHKRGDEFSMDDQMLMELLALGIDAKMSVSPGR